MGNRRVTPRCRIATRILKALPGGNILPSPFWEKSQGEGNYQGNDQGNARGIYAQTSEFTA
jgi:hypothetical protein